MSEPRARTGKTRQMLLSAAAESFAYRGYEGVTIRDIEKSACDAMKELTGLTLFYCPEA
ncbi:MAG: TetR family transcriptional regulator [Halieaceae bacterium]|jgi:AcrR family transcriptional regulator|nr:TetR family transcriptional regulator [Halieaceae bacterium]